jgi:hypothetical protein
MGHYLSEMLNPEPIDSPKKKKTSAKKNRKNDSKMKRDGEYFVKITHSVYVLYKGKKYEREECIINGQVSLQWKTWKNIDDDYNKYWNIGTQEEINELNIAYTNMSYLENFNFDEDPHK